jgi:hypothetical protein
MLVTPRERELDGVRLDTLKGGMIYDVSPTIAAWLMAQGYAASEMRSLSPQQPLDKLHSRHGRRRADD